MYILGYINLQKVADLLGAVFASFIPVSTKAGAECEYCCSHGDTWTWTTLTNVRDSDHRIPAHRRSSIHFCCVQVTDGYIPAENGKNLADIDFYPF